MLVPQSATGLCSADACRRAVKKGSCKHIFSEATSVTCPHKRGCHSTLTQHPAPSQTPTPPLYCSKLGFHVFLELLQDLAQRLHGDAATEDAALLHLILHSILPHRLEETQYRSLLDAVLLAPAPAEAAALKPEGGASGAFSRETAAAPVAAAGSSGSLAHAMGGSAASGDPMATSPASRHGRSGEQGGHLSGDPLLALAPAAVPAPRGPGGQGLLHGFLESLRLDVFEDALREHGVESIEVRAGGGSVHYARSLRRHSPDPPPTHVFSPFATAPAGPR